MNSSISSSRLQQQGRRRRQKALLVAAVLAIVGGDPAGGKRAFDAVVGQLREELLLEAARRCDRVAASVPKRRRRSRLTPAGSIAVQIMEAYRGGAQACATALREASCHKRQRRQPLPS